MKTRKKLATEKQAFLVNVFLLSKNYLFLELHPYFNKYETLHKCYIICPTKFKTVK